MIEHHIQRTVLEQLATFGTLRFRDLQPTDVDNNAFNYHLQLLLKQGLIQKVEGGYALSTEGLRYVDGLSTTNNRPRKQPKVLAIFALQNSRGEWLMAKRNREPNKGKLMLPSGKQHYAESPELHIQRELREQLGVQPGVELCGHVDMRISLAGEVVTHLVARVYKGVYEDTPPANSKFSYHWRPIDDDPLMIGGTAEIIAAVDACQPHFWLSLDVTE